MSTSIGEVSSFCDYETAPGFAKLVVVNSVSPSAFDFSQAEEIWSSKLTSVPTTHNILKLWSSVPFCNSPCLEYFKTFVHLVETGAPFTPLSSKLDVASTCRSCVKRGKRSVFEFSGLRHASLVLNDLLQIIVAVIFVNSRLRRRGDRAKVSVQIRLANSDRSA